MSEDFIIAIDFDGTICEDKFPDYGKLRDGAKDAIIALYAEPDVAIIINTCRHDEWGVMDYLFRKNIPFGMVNENHRGLIDLYGDCRKIAANVYVDDHNVFAERYTWSEIKTELFRKLYLWRKYGKRRS